jgi:hypothetical protein
VVKRQLDARSDPHADTGKTGQCNNQPYAKPHACRAIPAHHSIPSPLTHQTFFVPNTYSRAPDANAYTDSLDSNTYTTFTTTNSYNHSLAFF